jgi:predicted O-methyltransferase YrrM
VPALALKRTLYRAARTARHPRRLLEARQIRSEFVSRILKDDGRALARYERELRESGLMEHLFARAREQHDAVVRSGETYSLGAIGYREGAYLYSVMRTLRPRLAVETGVANGFSTAFLLQALEANGEGGLYSIDLPREVGREYEPGKFYEGEGRAGIPPGSEPGWLVPERLKTRWTLILGRSQEALPPLLAELGTIDFFMHDSEHSYECMSFEFETAWPALRPEGVLVSDDVNSNPAFFEFAARQGVEPIRLARGMALLTR